MKITFVLARFPQDIPIYSLPCVSHYAYPENARHSADQIKWYIDRLVEGNDMLIITLSDVLVNFTGQLIERKILDTKDVVIHLYENNMLERECLYHEKGYLENWPYGWFSADYGEIDLYLKARGFPAIGY